jgi:hypothetical protein
MGPRWVSETKKVRPTDRWSEYNFQFDFAITRPSFEVVEEQDGRQSDGLELT